MAIRQIIYLLIIASLSTGSLIAQDSTAFCSTEEVEKGFNSYKQQDYEIASRQFNQVITDTSNHFTQADRYWASLGLSLINIDLAEYEKAIRRLATLDDVLIQVSDKGLKHYILKSLAVCYLHTGSYRLSEKYYFSCLEYASESEIPFIRNEMIRVYIVLGEEDEALKIAQENLELFKKSKNTFAICVGYTTLGQVYMQSEMKDEGLNAWIECFKLAIDESEYDAVVWISQALSRHYEAENNLEIALRYQRYNALYKDSVQVDGSRIQLPIESVRSQMLKKQLEISDISTENERNKMSLRRSRLVIGLISVLLLFLFLILMIIRSRDKIKQHQLQLDLNRVRLNPHFIFNSLNSLQKSIITGDIEKSNKYLTRFSRLIREILDQSFDSFHPLSKEIHFLENYLDLERLRFDDKFDYHLKVSNILDPSSILIPSMLIQPLIENSIWHGILPLENSGIVNISFAWEENEHLLKIEIQDNGIGRQAAMKIREENSGPFTSKGTEILKNRIGIMKKLYNKSCMVKYSDHLDEEGIASGTLVQLYLPVKMV